MAEPRPNHQEADAPQKFVVGEGSMGEFARHQLEVARNDPRQSRQDDRAMMADFQVALEEAERVRTLSVMGLHELAQALTREEERLGMSHDSADLQPDVARTLQKAWERSRWAQAEIDNGTPHFNAQALISMNSALDAMIESFVKTWRPVLVRQIGERFLKAARDARPDAWAALPERQRKEIEDTTRREADEMVPKAARPKGSGTERYEKPLRGIGWGAPADRPLPDDMDQALAELGALRDVLVHRAGRVDDRALSQAPSLRYDVGEFVRLAPHDYRTYSAALRCYAQEVQFRGIRNWPEVTDEANGPHLADWRNYVVIGA